MEAAERMIENINTIITLEQDKPEAEFTFPKW